MSKIIFILLLFLINITFIIKFENISKWIGLFDVPDNKRKIHKSEISCIGGLFIFVNISYLIFYNFFLNETIISKKFFETELITYLFFYFTLSVIFIMGLIDDSYGLKPFLKILILTSIIFFLITFDEGLNINYLRFSFVDEVYSISSFSIYFTLFCIIVFINAFNMYDGSNLQISSISLIIFSYLLLIVNGKDFFLITLIISLISFSFLNSKNKLFLGDNGSLILSFIISYLFVKLYNKEIIYYADNVCLFLLLPVLDLLRLFIIRIINRKSPLKPDQNHLHHILMKRFSYRLTILILLSIYFVPIFFGILTKKYLIFIIIQALTYLIIYYSYKENSKYVK